MTEPLAGHDIQSETDSSTLVVHEEKTGMRLSPGHLARVEGWGMACHSISHVYQPLDEEGIAAVFRLGMETGRKIAFRGGGNSYGDASILQNGIILDLTRMDRILNWDPQSGIVDVEPGVTIQKLWRMIIADGWWPPVVSGTMFTTMGGCAAMNIHGKNNFRVGTFGEHIQEFDFLTPAGQRHTVTRESDPGLFHGAISGAGLLGCFTRIRLQMKKVYSGLLSVEALETPDVQSMVSEFELRESRMDYLVGWMDCLPGGRRLGRGIVHAAQYLKTGEDPRPGDTLNIGAQELPAHLFGAVPKSMLHLFMSPFINRTGVRLVNAAKFYSGRIQPNSSVHYQSHGAFAFLLDYVPDWKLAYRPIGLIQYQSFIPKETAVAAFNDILKTSRKAGLPPFLGVFKKHRPDDFLLSHAVDGYSLALDYRVTPKNKERLWSLARDLDEIVLDAGGKFYFAKDSTLTPEHARRFLGEDRLGRLRALKQVHDPDGLLQSDLGNRLELTG